jgi:hypothetical protein
VNPMDRARLLVLLLGMALLALGVAAASAFGATFTLALSGPATAVVGHPFVIQAGGTDPTDQGALYLEIDAIPTTVTSTCPSGYLSGSQLATSTGGDLVAFDQRENLDAAGNFSNPVGYTPKAQGGLLFCGYTDDGATDTLATSSMIVNVQSASGKKPANTKKPRVSRSHNNLICTHGSWSGSPSHYAYRWLVNGHAKKGAHGSKLAVTRSLRGGHKVQCSVTASNATGSSTAASAPFTVH